MLDSIAPPIEAATRAAEDGTQVAPQEYSPGTTLADRRGYRWLVTSYRTTVYREGTPPFEAWGIARAWSQFGPFTVVDAAGHKLAHPNPVAGCHHCPPVPCRCGDRSCTDFAAHRIVWASAETTVREAAA